MCCLRSHNGFEQTGTYPTRPLPAPSSTLSIGLQSSVHIILNAVAFVLFFFVSHPPPQDVEEKSRSVQTSFSRATHPSCIEEGTWQALFPPATIALHILLSGPTRGSGAGREGRRSRGRSWREGWEESMGRVLRKA